MTFLYIIINYVLCKKVLKKLGSTMLCLSNSSLSNTSKHSPAHHHSMAVNNESTIFQVDDDMHDNDDSSTSNDIENDSNCLHDTSDCNESSSFLKDSTHVDSKVFFNGLNGHKFYYNSSQDKIGFIPHNTDEWHPCPSSIPDTIIMQTEHESTWAWAHVNHKQELFVTMHLLQSHEMGPFGYCRGVQV